MRIRSGSIALAAEGPRRAGEAGEDHRDLLRLAGHRDVLRELHGLEVEVRTEPRAGVGLTSPSDPGLAVIRAQSFRGPASNHTSRDSVEPEVEHSARRPGARALG